MSTKHAEQLRVDLLEAMSLRAHESGVSWLSIWMHASAEDASQPVWPMSVIQLRKVAAWLSREQNKYRPGSAQRRLLGELTGRFRATYERLITTAQEDAE